MDIKKLERAGAIYQKIKMLDAQIIEIERHAMLIAEGETFITFKMDVTNLKAKREEESRVSFDSDGSLMNASAAMRRISLIDAFWSFPSSGADGGEKNNVKNKHCTTYDAELTDSAALQILGILLYEKQSERTNLLNKLNQMGVCVQ